MKSEDRELLERLGVTPGRSDLLFVAILALARRCEDQERRIADLERAAPQRLADRVRNAAARALGMA